MALSINPQAQLVAAISSKITEATNAANSAVVGAVSSVNKAALDAKISALSGDIGSTFNGIAGNLPSMSNVGSQLSAFGNSLPGASALGGIASTVQSKVGGALSGINSLQSAAGSISNIASDFSSSLNKLSGGNLSGGLLGLASNVSKAAGMLNNILSLKRGANLPSGGELFMKQAASVKLNSGSKDDWRVRINCNWNLFGDNILFQKLSTTGGFVFPYLPNITVSTKANYTPVDPVHNNYPFQAYKNSAVEDITIAGDFSCETADDAAYWIAATTFFKTATKMFFGNSTNSGNPPIICSLSGYGASMFSNVPIIIKSFTVDLKDDVNYIKCNTFGTQTWVPIMSTITIVVSPVYNRSRLRQFSIQDYARGKMTTSSGGGFI
jgi:hypothetical protein